MTRTNNISTITRFGLILASLCFLPTFKLPFWVIYLTAPQYPEGLEMYIWLHKLTGDIDIINGLNHYIGMGIIDEESFPEFKILPWAIGIIILTGLMTALLRKKTVFFTWGTLLLLFSALAVYDFWRWEYEYGHNLDPDAPINVPGMTYQPPLIGYKQLLNFGAYSYPHGGGWFYIAGVSITAILMVYEIYKNRSIKQNNRQ